MASWYEQLGLGEEYRQGRRLSLFTAEQHLANHAEVAEGVRISLHPRLLRRSDRALHARSFLVDRSGERLACTTEIVLVHVSLESRRPLLFPEDARGWLDDAIAAQASLSWDPATGSRLWREST